MHDQNIFDTSLVIDELREILDCRAIGYKLYAIYGDPAYRESDVLIRPFRRNVTGIADVDDMVNMAMSGVRIAVEWEFGHVANLFAFLKFKPGQKLLLSRVRNVLYSCNFHEKYSCLCQRTKPNKSLLSSQTSFLRRIYQINFRIFYILNSSNFI